MSYPLFISIDCFVIPFVDQYKILFSIKKKIRKLVVAILTIKYIETSLGKGNGFGHFLQNKILYDVQISWANKGGRPMGGMMESQVREEGASS